MKRLVVFALGLALAGCVTVTPQGPGAAPQMPSYVTVHAELASKFPNTAMVAPAGVTVDWGGFQSKYVAAGTSLGISRGDPEVGTAFLLGGGPQFHIPIGPHVLLIPAVNLAYRISMQGQGFAIYGSLGAAYRFDKMYLGLEAATPFLLGVAPTQSNTSGFEPFPGAVSVNALWGLYY